MDIPENLKNLERQKKWKELFREIIKIDHKDRTPEIEILETTALLNFPETATRPKDNDWVISTLYELPEAYRTEKEWLRNMALAQMNLEHYGMALRYLKQLKELYPKEFDRYLQSKFEDCLDDAACPMFTEPFSERVKRAWKAFVPTDKQVQDLASDAECIWDDQGQMEILKKSLGIAINGGEFFAYKADQGLQMVFSGQSSLSQLFAALYLKLHAPESVTKNWEIYIGEEPATEGLDKLDYAEVQIDDVMVSPKDVKIWVKQEKEGIYKIDMSADELIPLVTGEFEADCYGGLTELITPPLGEAIYEKYVEVDKFLEDLPKFPYLNPVQFRDYLEKRGLDVKEKPDVILNEWLQPYSRKPKGSKDELECRGDVISGLSKCLKFIEDFEEGYDWAASEFEMNGATFGYVCYSLDSFKGNEREKDIRAFREQIKSKLEGRLGKDAITIAGEAHGKNMDYIDLFVWNTWDLIPAAREIFKETPVSFSGFHVFRKNSPGVVLTGEPLWNPDGKFWLKGSV